MIRKLLSFVLTVALLFSITLTTVSAQSEDTPELYFTVTNSQNQKITSVNAGSDIKLNLYLKNYQNSLDDENRKIATGCIYINVDSSYFSIAKTNAFSNPYNNAMTVQGNLSNNLLSLLFETDSGIGNTFSISESDLDSKGGLLFSVQLTASKVLANKTCTFALSDNSNFALKNFTSLKFGCDKTTTAINYNNSYIPSKVTGLKADNLSHTLAKITWTKCSGVTGYVLYTSADKKTWTRIAALKGASSISYTHTNLTVGKTYYYLVRAYKTVDGVNLYGEKSLVISNIPMPAKVTGLKATSTGYNSAKITWTKSSGVSGYVVYRSADKKTWTRIAALKGASSISYTDKSLTAGKTYYYLIRAYKSSGGKNYYSSNSSAVSVKPVPNKQTITYLKNTNKNTITIKWQKQTGVSGYEIYYATNKNANYTYLKTVSGASNVSYTKSGLKKGTTYYFRVRAYKTVNGKRVYGAFSDYKYVKIQK
ncbi:MAG: fibronectin type III domain-containing protein [Acutalibacteraceae bacterium]|nr:fibronectin type III domain-containing protein [Acutalibacteraceae bacterium]